MLPAVYYLNSASKEIANGKRNAILKEAAQAMVHAFINRSIVPIERGFFFIGKSSEVVYFSK